MSDSAEGFGWWQASDGKWYAPGRGPEAAMRPAVEGSDVPPLGDNPESEVDDAVEDHADAHPAEVRHGTPRRTFAPLGSVLDRGVWVWLWVIGAIVLIVLIIVAVSQVSPSQKKGATTPEATITITRTTSGTLGPGPPAARL